MLERLWKRGWTDEEIERDMGLAPGTAEAWRKERGKPPHGPGAWQKGGGRRSPESLCWLCGRAADGCSWAKRFEPVEGWTAVRRDVGKEQDRVQESYLVLRCPLFRADTAEREEREEWDEERKET